MTSKNTKKITPANNKNINTNVKRHTNEHSKRTISEQSNLLVEITTEPALTCKEASQTIIDLSDDLPELTKEIFGSKNYSSRTAKN
ncbi:hypothetical protein C1645_837084 [Glomus cerebriforme]|uniref:Uncharacterized protein n=1 Tax=Glomus cerebriforme TaxID=658196 RepID=A0A397S4R5_9GLOM|nr:hypothetical protein C1645_837084 [Glomus cerebriforme]